MSSVSRLRVLGFVVTLACLAVGCNDLKKIEVGATCLLNTDCNQPLVCTMSRCHEGCRATVDCPVGEICTRVGDIGVCQLPDEAKCTADVPCGPLLICAPDLRCRASCSTPADCMGGQVCVQNVCAERVELDVSGQLPQMAAPPIPDAGSYATASPDALSTATGTTTAATETATSTATVTTTGGAGAGGAGMGGTRGTGGAGAGGTGTNVDTGGTSTVVTFQNGAAIGQMTGWGWIAQGALDSVTDPTCGDSKALITQSAPCMTATNWNASNALCVTGTIPVVPANATQVDWNNNWGIQIGVDVGNPVGPIGKAYSTIAVSVSNAPTSGFRIELHRTGDPATTTYCFDGLSSGTRVPLTSFNTACWDNSGIAFLAADAAKVDKVGVQVSSTMQAAITLTNMCLNSITFGDASSSAGPRDAGSLDAAGTATGGTGGTTGAGDAATDGQAATVRLCGASSTGGARDGGGGTNVVGMIPNGSFEQDPPATADNAITGWDVDLYTMSDASVRGTPSRAVHVLEVSSARSFVGGQSLRSFLQNVQGVTPGDSVEAQSTRRVTHEIHLEVPISTTASYVTFWRSDTSFTPSSRYYWEIALVLSDGTQTVETVLACKSWGDSEGCLQNLQECSDQAALGADGQSWHRYRVDIPSGIDRSRLLVALRHRQDSWDSSTASSEVFFDGVVLE
jgi:hypothetical protein